MANPLLVGVPERYLIDGVEQSEKVLGGGSYGVVFEGQWRGTRVAIKRHHYILVRDENGHLSSPYRRFLEEFSMLKELPHPNIVQVFGMVPPTLPQDTPGLVMECLHQTLRKRYAESPPLSRLDEATVFLGVVSALDYLHSRRVVHRDVTTHNIMVCDAAGTGGLVKAKITDVGGAAMMADGARSQSMSLNPGAQVYMAPETQESSGHEGQARYGPPADCYSCALSMMSMCIRREPPNIFVLLKEGRGGDLDSVGEDHPMHSIIVRCLEADPGLRPTASQLCRELADVQLRLKNIQAEQPTTAATRGNTTDEQVVDHPDLVSARAEIDDLRQAMAAVNGRGGDLLAERDGLLGERDDLLAERDGLLAERDDLLAGRDRSAAENSDLQRAVTDADMQRDALMRDLFAEQDRLTVENVQLRQQGDALQEDLSQARQAETRQPPARAPHYDVLEFITSQTDKSGMLARCSLLRPPSLAHLNLTTLPKWVALGKVPKCERTGSIQCVVHNRLYILTTSSDGEERAWSSPSDDLCQEIWTEIGLPQEFGNIRVDSTRLFLHNGELYACNSPSRLTSQRNIWKRNDRTSRWESVATMPCRFWFSLSVVGDSLIVAGGSQSRNCLARAEPDVMSLNLVQAGAGWVAWPNWPSLSSAPHAPRECPNIAATAGKVHIIGGERNDQSPFAVLTADLSLPPRERVWSNVTIPPPPRAQCAALVANDQLLVCGGKTLLGKSSKSYMFSGISKSWLPLPDILTDYTQNMRQPTLHSTQQGILMVSHHGIAELRW